MGRCGFIKATRVNEKLKPEERKPEGTCLVNVNEIAFVLTTDQGSVIFMKDYATNIYVLEKGEELQMKINAARGGEQWIM